MFSLRFRRNCPHNRDDNLSSYSYLCNAVTSWALKQSITLTRCSNAQLYKNIFHLLFSLYAFPRFGLQLARRFQQKNRHPHTRRRLQIGACEPTQAKRSVNQFFRQFLICHLFLIIVSNHHPCEFEIRFTHTRFTRLFCAHPTKTEK